jgi:hypothetical protein
MWQEHFQQGKDVTQQFCRRRLFPWRSASSVRRRCRAGVSSSNPCQQAWLPQVRRRAPRELASTTLSSKATQVRTTEGLLGSDAQASNQRRPGQAGLELGIGRLKSVANSR